MIDINNFSIEELEAVVKTEDWILALLTDPTLETDRKWLIDYHTMSYIQQHYTDEGRLHSWSCYDGLRSGEIVLQMIENHPWQQVKHMSIRNDPEIHVEIKGNKWIDIWVAASKCIDLYNETGQQSDREFIEYFMYDKANNELIVVTGT